MARPVVVVVVVVALLVLGGPSGADGLCLAVDSHRLGPRETARSPPRFLGLEDSGVPLLFHVGES